ncbi:AMP-binding protein [Cupriavidus basilensis]
MEARAPQLGAKVVSAWGMTEMGAVTTTRLEDDDERAIHTDGCPLPGVEVRVADAAGAALPPRRHRQAAGAVLLQLRRLPAAAAPERPPTPRGWFDTGDLARIDARGYIRIDGRSKDVIIRGGENIPVDGDRDPAVSPPPGCRRAGGHRVLSRRAARRARLCAFVVTMAEPDVRHGGDGGLS